MYMQRFTEFNDIIIVKCSGIPYASAISQMHYSTNACSLKDDRRWRAVN